MDTIARVRAGMHAEVIAELEPASRRGSSAASNDLAVVYRVMGDKRLEAYYAATAYQQDPYSLAALGTLFRALYSTGQHRLLTDVYAAVHNPAALDRYHHLNAALAYIQINRTHHAKTALALLADFPRRDVGELEVALALASSLSDHEQAVTILDQLEGLGVEAEDRRISQYFAAGDMRRTLEAIQKRSQTPRFLEAHAKKAIFSAIALGEGTELAPFMAFVPDGVRRLAEGFLAGLQEVQVMGRSKSYRFAFDAANFSVALQQVTGNFYEEGTLRLLQRLLSPGDQVVDVGANIGNHSIFFAGEAGCQVIPFECNPNLVPRLRSSVAMSSLESMIDFSHLGSAVSDRVGTAHFNFIRDDFSNLSDVETANTREVPALSLDSLGLSHCRLVKIDVDGGELAVLRGARNLLATVRPIIAIEVMNYNMAAVLDLFASHQYVIAREDFRVETYSDMIFAPREMASLNL
ncbi:hypothetical protein BH11PSE1_BH11PSE1_11330 [soil metagenome]